MVSTTNMWTIVCSWYGYVDLLYIGGMGMWIYYILVVWVCGSIIYWWYEYVDLCVALIHVMWI